MHPPQMPYPLGKLPAEHLARLLIRYAPTDERVILGPGVGRDAAVISFGDRYLIAKTDPITFASDEIGWYAVHINANDVACTGAALRWFLATLLLPEAHTDAALVDTIFDQIAGACAELDVPFLTLDMDILDPRTYAPEQIRTRMEGFVELLDRKADSTA